MSRISGKVAVVTGASKGIGASIAEHLAAEGASVVVNYASSRSGADAVVARITEKGGKAIAIQGNVSVVRDIQRLFAETKKAYGKLDILVNNAGVYEFAPLEAITPEHIHKQVDLNVIGLIFATQEAVKLMGPQGGSIVNIGSIVGPMPAPQASVYSAAKAAVDAISVSLSQELGPRKIRVNSLDPGAVETEGLRTSGLSQGAFREQQERETPLGRIAQPDDIAPAAAFLASDDARWRGIQRRKKLSIAVGLYVPHELQSEMLMEVCCVKTASLRGDAIAFTRRRRMYVVGASRPVRNRVRCRNGRILPPMRLPKPCGGQADASELSFQDAPTRWWRPMFDATSLPDLNDDLGSFALPEGRAGNPSDKDLQRAEGSGRIVLSGSEKGTRIIDVFQRSPIRIMFPKVCDGTVKEAVLVNTAGGVAGGDRLEFSVTVLANASIAVTSQAAEKVYRALSEPARITTTLKACDTAKLAWLPQETIVFNWGRITRKTEIDLSSRAELLALEWLVLGRAAHGEEMVGGHITDSWHVKKDGRLIWADSFRATDEMFQDLHRKVLLSNCNAVATLIYFGPYLDRRLEFSRDIAPSLECHCAATSVGGLIIVRFAAKVSSDLRLALRNFLQQFSRELGPGPFRVPKMWSC